MSIKNTVLITLLTTPVTFSSLPALAEYIDLPEESVSSMLNKISEESESMEMSSAGNQLESMDTWRSRDMPGMMPGGMRPMYGRSGMPPMYRPGMNTPPGESGRYTRRDNRQHMGDLDSRMPGAMGYRSRRHMDNWSSGNRGHMHDSRGMPMMGMMHGKHEQMRAHMARLEKKLGNIEFLLRQLVELQKQ